MLKQKAFCNCGEVAVILLQANQEWQAKQRPIRDYGSEMIHIEMAQKAMVPFDPFTLFLSENCGRR